MSKFANACIMSYNDWVATIPEELPEPQYSKRHVRRMNALMDKMRGNVYHHFTTRAIKIMLVAAVLFALLLTAFIIPSSREFIIDNMGIYSTYKLTEDNRNSVNDKITVGYIPEGFELESEEKYSKLSMCCYTTENGDSFTIYKDASSMKVEFDTEKGNSEKIIINDLNFTIFTDDNQNCSVMWTQNDYIYQIDGQLSKEEMLKIAETVK